jgi:hypothetical protein
MSAEWLDTIADADQWGWCGSDERAMKTTPPFPRKPVLNLLCLVALLLLSYGLFRLWLRPPSGPGKG